MKTWTLVNRRTFVTGLGAVLAAPLAAEVQPAGKVWQLGVLLPAFPTNDGTWVSDELRRSLRDGLRELGYIEDRNIVIQWRSDPASAPELVAQRVDVIVAGTNTHIAAAQKATKTIPIVMVHPTDPVRLGFVEDLARPGRNITGLSLQSPEVFGKRLQFLREVLPNLSRLAILWDPGELSGFRETVVRDAVSAAQTLGMETRLYEAHGPRDIETVFAAMSRDSTSALFIAGGIRTQTWTQLAIKNRLPTICGAPRSAELGCLIFYGANFAHQYRHAATYVDKILKGAKPGDLPIEQPTKFELVINVKTAEALGLTIPPSLLLRADQVIE